MASTADRHPGRTTVVLGLAAVAALLILGVCQSNFVDPDVWHEMALIRQARLEGALPTRDTLAYTRTLSPTIHHEWGTGAILLLSATTLGGSGLLLLKFALTAGIAAACVAAARRSAADTATFCSLAPVAIFLSWYGFSTVRAQMFTLLFTAVLMFLLSMDRRGKRGWVLIWLCVHVCWLNLHAGFVVGLLLLACHAVEQAARRQPIAHLIGVFTVSLGLVLANPYGWTYVEFLWHSLRLSRPAIEEWLPTWQAPVSVIGVFALSLVLLLYSAAKLGVRQLPGLLPLLAAAWAGLSHQRHLSIYAIVWVCLVPAWMSRTALGLALSSLWVRRPATVRAASAAIAAICIGATLMHQPWRVSLPSQPGDHPDLTYPVGAVAWLDEIEFRGNLEVPFLVGAFVAWKLNPDVLVSIDSRYEVAYPPEALQSNLDTYAARPGWEQRLEEQGTTDAVLVPTGGPLSAAMRGLSGWTRGYQDDAFEIYMRTGWTRPAADRRGQVVVGTFP